MRQAVNAPIQGSAVDMTSLAMVWIGRELRKLKLDASCLMHGHDEIATFSHISCVEQVDKIMNYYMVDYMREFTNFSIPLKVDTAIVHRWSEKHEK
jgi:DNA polymerase I-like protein with 3'-5' exonuclease and polymerase domains